MTEEEFENKLRDRINNTLESDQEEFTSERWAAFEKKLIFSKNKKRFAAALRIAAIILLFVCGGIAFLVYNKSYKKNHTEVAADNNSMSQTPGRDISAAQVTGDSLKNHRESEKGGTKVYQALNNVKAAKEQKITAKNDSDSAKVPANYTRSEDHLNKQEFKPGIAGNEQTKQEKTDNVQKQLSGNNATVQNLHEPEPTLKLKTTSKEAFRFGANVSSIVNYDQANHNSAVHFGGGVFFEVNLIENLALYSGVQVTNQNINFQNEIDQSLALGKHIRTKDLQLTGFDIPINLKYRFNISNTGFFISSGISSLTFIKEDIKTTYDVRSTVVTITGVETVSKEESETNSLGSFDDFYFAKVLNLSFGLELPLYSRNILLIEPYIKYSLGSLKKIDVHPSVFGINLGIIF